MGRDCPADRGVLFLRIIWTVLRCLGTTRVPRTGARSIADIDKIMAELQMARDYLRKGRSASNATKPTCARQSEAERVRRVNGRYGHLAATNASSPCSATSS